MELIFRSWNIQSKIFKLRNKIIIIQNIKSFDIDNYAMK